MCGIVGYIGNKQAYPILIKGLQRLEYRGYDSAGVALITDNNDLVVYKTRGKVSELEHFTASKDTSGTVGIAHTRWATHGEPNDVNAHPHYSQSESIAMIHNGIIENYAVLKADLMARGFTFKSNTDTEVLVQLIEYVRKTNNVDLFHAVQLALTQVIGAYAIAVVENNDPDTIVAARKSSPLVVGIGDDEFFLGSDASPIIEFTDRVIYLEDDEVVRLQRGKEPRIFNLNNVEKSHEIIKLEMSLSQLEKGGYPHFMLKEIFEQPNTIRECMRGRINVDHTSVAMSGIIDNKEKFLSAERIIIAACGTSWHAGLIGEYLIEEFARIPVEVEYASEFRYRNPIVHKGDVVIVISQSGETADTLAAAELAKAKGAFVYGICNVVGSSIPRMTHSGSYTHAGPEIGVASTKAFTAQVTVLSLIALTIAKEKGTMPKDVFERYVAELASIPDKMEETLQVSAYIEKFSRIFTYAKNFLYLGRGYNYPVALEGALKLKEISYIHAEGYPAAEMKHGPIALIDHEMPTVVIAPNKGHYDKVVSNIQEIKARKGRVVAIITKGDAVIRDMADFYIEIPETEEGFVPLLAALPLQLMAYYIAIIKGCDVDQPRNLAKSVTVE
ncbi:MAG: Glutamine--fructose-6-phosphate aminotransferase (isomerizing) [Bacteroidetes bacterium ADurb.Bin416]|jgi:glucosamine--fructose-6-phosphate aminotransferase (isomerizing)|nr:MAG: Glutamine--fructose-6-phosphate aminotransferase (isomerizing) [Bacteroidetes bacterium ADurb.Bin416]